jgi:hypothetical protein
MKDLYLVVLIALFSLCSLNAEEKGAHLFILSGQSNMAALKPEISFTPTVESKFGKDKVIVVKDAKSGAPIRGWFKKWKSLDGKQSDANGSLYKNLMVKVKGAIKNKKIQTVTFVWMQGERDAKEKYSEVYAASLKGLLGQLQEDLSRQDINFVLGRLSDFDMKDKKYQHWTKVRKIQVEFAEDSARRAWVDTDELNGKKNGLHYDKAGYKELGKRFAEKAITLIEAATK